MLSSVLEAVSNNKTANEVLQFIGSERVSSLKSSKFFRILSVVTGALTASYVINRFYLDLYRRYYNMPSGPYGAPLIGQAFYFQNPYDLLLLGPKQCAISITAGPTLHVISINDPYLMKKVYADPRTVNSPPDFFPKADNFAFQNGEQWSKRRKIIYANLMSTMKAKFVETATKAFIKNKVFTVFDDRIEKKEKIAVKELLRPLGFNIILQACFGQELKTLDDPFWLKYDGLLQEMGRNKIAQGIIVMLCGGENRVSDFVQKSFGIQPEGEIWNGLADLTEEFAMNRDNDLKNADMDENVKLFNDYIEEYTSGSNGKIAKKQLLGDMSAMFMAATDTVKFRAYM